VALAVPGVPTAKLNNLAEKLIKQAGCQPTFKNYRAPGCKGKPFPAALCTCINEQIVHCPPSEKVIIKPGDLLSLDLGLRYRGYCTDMATTIGIEPLTPQKRHLLRAGKKALKRGIKQIRTGKTTGDIGRAIEHYTLSQNLSIIKQLCGHGIGKKPHLPPDIPNFGLRGHGQKLHTGQFICLEPMISTGSGKAKEQKNGAWVTADNALAVHFEHTILVTKNSSKIITKKEN